MDWSFVLGLGVIFLVLVIPLIYFGRRLSTSVKKQSPESEFVVSVTPVGNALAACLVGFWGACVIAFKLAPNSAFGTFLASVEGVVTAALGSMILYVFATVLLKKLGYPSSRKDGRGT